MLPFLRRHALVLSITLCLFSGLAAYSLPHLAPEPAQRAVTVYVTRTGEKYHRGSCRHLSQSKIPMERAEAIQKGYTACKVCRPAR